MTSNAQALFDQFKSIANVSDHAIWTVHKVNGPPAIGHVRVVNADFWSVQMRGKQPVFVRVEYIVDAQAASENQPYAG